MASHNGTAANSAVSLASPYGSDPNSPKTTFVQADPANFRAVVQRLTGASEDPSTQKLPVTFPSRPAQKHPSAVDIGPRKTPFKLHERRHRKLEIKLGGNDSIWRYGGTDVDPPSFAASPSAPFSWQRGFVMVSPVSTLDLFARGSPRTPREEEERAIAEKGFYLHPSTPRDGDPPELLPLFPLHSPRDDDRPTSSRLPNRD